MYASIFEIALITSVLAQAVFALTAKRGTISAGLLNIFSVITVFSLAALYYIRLILDHATWRITGATVFVWVFFLIIFGVLRPMKKHAPAGTKIAESKPVMLTRRISGGAGILACVLSLAFVIIFPADDLPAPSGRYKVGTASFMVTDASRTGVYLDEPGQARRMMVQAWYPATNDVGKARKAPWIPDVAMRDALADYGKLPHFTQGHLAKVRTNSYPGLAVSDDEKTMPVVIISHGWTGSRFDHVDLAEELASRGIVVFGIDHPYGSMSVTLTDGTVLPLMPEALPWDNRGPQFMPKARILVQTYTDDILAVIAKVRADDTIPALRGRLDPSRIALAGHSTGAGAAVRVILNDNSITAMLGLDAWVEPLDDAVLPGSTVPQLHLGSEMWKNGFNAKNLSALLAASADSTYFYLKKSAHMDFAMLRYFTRAARLIGWGGEIDQKRFGSIVNLLAGEWLEAQVHLPSAKNAPALTGTNSMERMGTFMAKAKTIPELGTR